jgi:hypothetical protein
MESQADDPHPVPALAFCELENTIMLMILASFLIVLWALGLVTSITLGGIIHMLLVLAILIVLLKEIRDQEST